MCKFLLLCDLYLWWYIFKRYWIQCLSVPITYPVNRTWYSYDEHTSNRTLLTYINHWIWYPGLPRERPGQFYFTPCIEMILLADCPYHAMPTSGFHQKSVGENNRQSVSKYSSSKCVRWVVQVIAVSYLMTKQKWT